MSDHGEQTVRELRASVQEWAKDIDEMVMLVGNDGWLDIDIADLNRISESGNVIATLRAWGEMAATWQQIATLPERDDRMGMT